MGGVFAFTRHRHPSTELRYIHRNPVERGWVERPEDWEWSSVRHYGCGEVGPVEIESQWTVRKRERAGIFVTLKMRAPAKDPPKRSLDGAPSTPDRQS